jgi:hypothetical protein
MLQMQLDGEYVMGTKLEYTEIVAHIPCITGSLYGIIINVLHKGST